MKLENVRCGDLVKLDDGESYRVKSIYSIVDGGIKYKVALEYAGYKVEHFPQKLEGVYNEWGVCLEGGHPRITSGGSKEEAKVVKNGGSAVKTITSTDSSLPHLKLLRGW